MSTRFLQWTFALAVLGASGLCYLFATSPEAAAIPWPGLALFWVLALLLCMLIGAIVLNAVAAILGGLLAVIAANGRAQSR